MAAVRRHARRGPTCYTTGAAHLGGARLNPLRSSSSPAGPQFRAFVPEPGIRSSSSWFADAASAAIQWPSSRREHVLVDAEVAE